jgi:hypothetical protein
LGQGGFVGIGQAGKIRGADKAVARHFAFRPVEATEVACIERTLQSEESAGVILVGDHVAGHRDGSGCDQWLGLLRGGERRHQGKQQQCLFHDEGILRTGMRPSDYLRLNDRVSISKRGWPAR